MEKDVMLRSRMTAKQMEVLDQIVAELQEQTPEANVSTSSVARYALEKYVDTHIAKRDGTKLFIEVSTLGLTKDEIAALYDSVNKMVDNVPETASPALKNAFIDLSMGVTSAFARSIMQKKAV
jgi:uncharacterized protein (DUF2235 family)